MSVWSDIVDAFVILASLVAILDYFGIKPKSLGGTLVPFSRRWKLAIMLILVGASAALSGYGFYRSLRPRIIEKIVERPVEKIVPCPEQKEPVVTPVPGAKPPKSRGPIVTNTTSAPKIAQAPQGGIQQSNSGGVNVLQGTTGENSPIINSPITVGDVPKRISPEDLTKITQYLATAQTKKHIKINAFQNGNAVPFAKDIYKAFHDAGWPMSDNGIVQALGIVSAGQDFFQGAIITVKGTPIGPSDKITVSSGDPLYCVSAVLDSLKIPRVLSRELDFDDDMISIQFQSIPQ